MVEIVEERLVQEFVLHPAVEGFENPVFHWLGAGASGPPQHVRRSWSKSGRTRAFRVGGVSPRMTARCGAAPHVDRMRSSNSQVIAGMPSHFRDAIAPGLCEERSALSNKRACGTPDARRVRGLVCISKKHTSVVTTVTPNIVRRSARDGLTAYVVLSPAPDSGFWSPSRPTEDVSGFGRSRLSVGLDATRGIRTTRLCRPRAAWSSAFPCRLTDPRIGGDPPCLHIRA